MGSSTSRSRSKHEKTPGFVFESEVLIEAARLGFRALPIPVATRARLGPRPSHFRPRLDIARITGMVAGSLLARGLYLPGLYRSLSEPVWPKTAGLDAVDAKSVAHAARRAK